MATATTAHLSILILLIHTFNGELLKKNEQHENENQYSRRFKENSIYTQQAMKFKQCRMEWNNLKTFSVSVLNSTNIKRIQLTHPKQPIEFEYIFEKFIRYFSFVWAGKVVLFARMKIDEKALL